MIRLKFFYTAILISFAAQLASVADDGTVVDQSPPTRQAPAVVEGTVLLEEAEPIDQVMVAGIDRFALRAIEASRSSRHEAWNLDYSSTANYDQSLLPHRKSLAEIIGVVDERIPPTGIEFIGTTRQPSLVSQNEQITIHNVRWQVLQGITAEGLFLRPKRDVVARVVALPDADWTPEMITGLEECDSTFARDLALLGCEVLVPTLISRDTDYSGNPAINRQTNLSHREFIYRQAFQLGRHVIGYEVQKVLAAVDQFALRDPDLPVIVAGVGEGGLLAFYSAAIDTRIDVAVVSGYFDQREGVWREPIYRNIWNLLNEFGDAEIASMIAPRRLFIEASPLIPEVDGPAKANRNVAAPGVLRSPDPTSVMAEVQRAQQLTKKIPISDDPKQQPLMVLGHSGQDLPKGGSRSPLEMATLHTILGQTLSIEIDSVEPSALGKDHRDDQSHEKRQARQVQEMVDFTQNLLRHSHKTRDKRFGTLDRSSLDAFIGSAETERKKIHQELFGELPSPTMSPNPRSRLVLEDPKYLGYEVVLDVYPDVIASGILLLPRDMAENEKRPVIVCQHGLEGTPMDTIAGPGSRAHRYYKSFAAELARRGFIVYAPQNPYRGGDAFRTLQRKSNLLGRSLFSYIIPQHLVTLRWLSTLDHVDAEHIGFYGLSYGGKTAVRVPPMLPPRDDEPGYCLSICSADFNEWVAKNASSDAPFSYLWTPEYEIFEWNMGHVANYAELSILMVPRPFMVERGHDDGVGIDEWVAWEYAKVRRDYNKLGIGDKTEIEFFDGPHTIHGQGTFAFLHRHLGWPLSKANNVKEDSASEHGNR